MAKNTLIRKFLIDDIVLAFGNNVKNPARMPIVASAADV
jgi:hypothetical protein